MRALNRMLVCVATVLATLLPSTSSARENVYFNFGFSSGYPATRYYSYPDAVVVHAVPVYPPPVRHYYHYYTPRHYYYHHYTPQYYHHYYKPRHGHFDRHQPHHHGRRDDYRHHWRDGGDRSHRGRGHDDRRGGSRTFVKRDD